ncbi:cytochrome P450 [Bombardia bombarda]|uniref:Cytochrome P450 n=1 Tax=Bombardia bombarda TaxID=252184 RepID=A0AA39X6U8_9PEZI|nr:cytochrome P450 [Bombardia bombarda]
MSSSLAVLSATSFSLFILWVVYCGYCLYSNYVEARKIGVLIRVIRISHLNYLWLLIDKRVISMVKQLPGPLGDNSFTRYNYRGWHEHDSTRSHDEMGDAFVVVTPDQNWLYLANPDALTDTCACNKSLNEQCNAVVWTEAASLTTEMARYWSDKQCFSTVAEDVRTLSLHILCRACFGKSFPFVGHDQVEENSPSASFRRSLLTIIDHALLILALGPKFFNKPWLPRRLRRLGEACATFKDHMTRLYHDEQRTILNDYKADSSTTLVASLIRASQHRQAGEGALTEAEIYGTMFVFSFAGHDTTSHALTFAMFYLAANPAVQAWLKEELVRVLGDRPCYEWDYHADFPRLQRCLAILCETLRLKTPVAESLRVEDKTHLVIPAGTLIIPSYVHVQKHTKYWGSEWKPSRWISSTSGQRQFPFLGWSEGARDCPGKKFSHVEWVATMAALFRDWKVDPLRYGQETSEDAQKRVLDMIETNTGYGELLLQLNDPERTPLV